MTRRLCWATWCLSFCLILLTGGRTPISGDAAESSLAAQGLLAHGRPDLPPTLAHGMVRGRDGRAYSKYSWVPILMNLAPVLTERAWGSAGFRGLRLLSANLLPAALGATTATGIVAVATLSGASALASFWVGVLAVFSTPLWPYGRIYYSEGVQAAVLIWLLFTLQRARGGRRPEGWLVLSGLLAGVALNTKTALALFVLAIAAAYVWNREWRKNSIRLLLYGGLGLAPGVAAWLWLNAVRFGDFLGHGYSLGRDGAIGFGVPLLSGIYGLFFSAGKSVFLYAPILVLALFAWRSGGRRMGSLFWGALAGSLALTAVVAKWWAWHGDVSWGPRLIVPLLPIWILPLCFADLYRRPLRWAILALAAAGVGIQFLGILVPDEFFANHLSRLLEGTYYHGASPQTLRDELLFAHFVPEFSPIAGNLWVLAGHWMEPSAWLQAHPWRTLHVVQWTPSAEWRVPALNLWFDGRPSSWVAAAVLLGLTVMAARRVRSVLKTDCAG